uniref:Uncharacterized protein n=1 Tax=Oryza meridionalis TaxID=40149 RepID=A0A0E0CI28_9ORYZ
MAWMLAKAAGGCGQASWLANVSLQQVRLVVAATERRVPLDGVYVMHECIFFSHPLTQQPFSVGIDESLGDLLLGVGDGWCVCDHSVEVAASGLVLVHF